MGVQEEYKRILTKMIDRAKNDKIQTSEQFIQMLISELSCGEVSQQEEVPYKPIQFKI